jgi:GNAT superfamily N-acetyltransferase
MQIIEYGAADASSLQSAVHLLAAINEEDAPWRHAPTVRRLGALLSQGDEGEPPRAFLGLIDGKAVAHGLLIASDYDNRHLARLAFAVHPDERHRGYGAEMLATMREEAHALGRQTIRMDGWDSEKTRRFAHRHGFSMGSRAVNRRQETRHLTDDELGMLGRRARERGADYEILRLHGETPEELVDDIAAMTAAINDAPKDALSREPEVFDRDRIRAHERAVDARGDRAYRVVARHRRSGELAGHSLLVVEGERPHLAHQEDTAVVRHHRGVGLSMLLKTTMLEWLRSAEPGLEQIDTWNAESNAGIAAVNERLGFTPMGRELRFQVSA